MTRGERITLIKRLASTLSDETWADVYLTLDEFGIPYDDRQFGRIYEMVLNAARQAADEVLLELNAHLHPDARGAPSSASGGPFEADAFRLFVSHTHEHRKFAGELRESLTRLGIDAFVAHDTIEPTREWLDEIESALRTCDALVALLTDDFVESKWCDQEIGFCVARSVAIVPLRMLSDPHGFIGKYQGLTVAPNDRAHSVAPKIFDLLGKHDLAKPRMIRPIIQRYVRSNSFQNTRDTFPLVEGLSKREWTDQMVQDVLTAAATNTQVEHANLVGGRPVPEAMREHLATLGLLPTTHASDDIPF
jgi:hypothetical protein